MPANFSNIKITYTLPEISGSGNTEPALPITFDLSSINFDINHTTVGPETPFTTEMDFDLRIINEGDQFDHVEELVDLLIRRPDFNFSKIQQNASDLENITIFLSHILEKQGKSDGQGFIKVDFQNVTEATTPRADGTLYQVKVILKNPHEKNLFDLIWAVQLKFSAMSPKDPCVLYPKVVENILTITSPDKSLLAFNDELRLNYELTCFKGLTESTGTDYAGPIGKAADELTDSINHLASSIASNLSSTIKTQLQPAGNFISDDVALWLVIKKSTDDLSFSNFYNFVETLFSGDENDISADLRDTFKGLQKRRSSPFMNVDIYEGLKIAAEAFVMTNCMVDQVFTPEDVEELKQRIRVVDGIPNPEQVKFHLERLKTKVNGGPGMLPVVAIINNKVNVVKPAFNLKAITRNVKLRSAVEATTWEDDNYDYSYERISEKLTHPCYIELIWSYWHEESMMVQGLHTVCRRFQNIRSMGKNDPLANLEIDPLRPLNNLLWGYIQDEQHRLSVRRRAFEYNHQYGVSLIGEAAREMRFADPRSKFIEAFHTLLNLASRFYKQADDMTVKPDGFPILNGLRETHLILSEGMHNQYGDLPSTSRSEMLLEQYMLSRPEFREFLPIRTMVAYPEPWMDRVAALNQLMGFTKTSVLHFNYMAVFGEKIMLSIRFSDWATADRRADEAANWANFWRPEIQAYIHSYRAATGVDLSADGVAAGQRVDVQQPSVHLYNRLMEQRKGANGIATAAQADSKSNGRMPAAAK